MCGINGIFAYRATAPLPREDNCLAVRDAMRERGPDGAGLFCDGSGRCLIGHRRLAIIDLSDAGAQPMTLDGLTISFNGEIYNYRELRAELEATGVRFSTATDTEVLLHLFRRDGPDMIPRIRGMFAFALWDSKEAKLFLARDPHGIKPLYYSDDGESFRFASSLRALRRGGGFSVALDPRAVVAFLGWGSVPEPLTMYHAVRALPAGSTLVVSGSGVGAPKSYWSISELYRAKRSLRSEGVDDIVRASLLDTIRAHLVADVPVGLFLSSGIDSGVLLGLASEVHPEPLRTVTLAFSEFRGTDHDEAPLARDVARHYGASHSEVELSARSVQESMQEFLSAMDQPTVDGLNVYWISKAVRQTGLKAALSGLGGDELFGGYPSFKLYPRLRSLAGACRVPGLIQGAALLARASKGPRSTKLRSTPKALSSRSETFQLIRGLFTLAEVRQLLHPDVWAAAGGAQSILKPVEDALGEVDVEPWREVAIAEQSIYMRNQLLRDADWASMKHSLELRVPLVDRQFSESVAPWLGASPRGKARLARSLERRLPEPVLRRRKTGFALPMQQWVAEEIRTNSLRLPPKDLLHPEAPELLERMLEGVATNTVHWSRAWALHCLAHWVSA